MSDGGFRYEVQTLQRALTRDDVLTEKEAADALQISLDKFRNAHFPTAYFGRDGRVIWGMVLDLIADRARNAA